VKKQDISENLVNTVFLSLGSNLGNKILNLNKAKYLILDSNTEIIKTSNYYETLSWPNKKFPKYINIVLKIITNLKPSELFIKLKKIENMLGRKASKKNSPRICDIDILDFNQKKYNFIVKKQKVIIPHPRLHKRSFVLIPLYEVSRNWYHPLSNEKIAILLSKINNKELTTIKLI
tara:strand:+ start:591 stop:1118 length:528 start_codon:yes stop_codon:yes gene_type:complete